MAARELDQVGEAFDERQLAAEIEKLKGSYLECRTLGHAWKIQYMGPVTRSDMELASRARHHPWNPDGARILRCTRCRTERVDLCLVGYGRRAYGYRLVARYYRYADDYKVEGANNHREMLHEELFRRQSEKGTK